MVCCGVCPNTDATIGNALKKRLLDTMKASTTDASEKLVPAT
jgi:hypothetical protein